MTLILEFLLFLLIAGLIVFLVIGFRFYLMIRRTMGKFKQFAGGRDARSGSTGRNGSGSTQSRRNTVIVDTRSEEERNKKIFASDVGEYVSYKTIR